VNYFFNSWSKLGGSNHSHLLLIRARRFAGQYGSQGTMWFLTNRGHTGYDFGLCGSARMMTRNGFVMFASY